MASSLPQVTGAREFRGISIDPSAVDPDDVEVLEDLITVAIQDAMNRANALAEEKWARLPVVSASPD